MVEFDLSLNNLISFQEKPPMWEKPLWANAGFLVMSSACFSDAMQCGGDDFFRDAFPSVATDFYVFPLAPNSCFDIGTIEGYSNAVDTYGRTQSASKWVSVQDKILN